MSTLSNIQGRPGQENEITAARLCVDAVPPPNDENAQARPMTSGRSEASLRHSLLSIGLDGKSDGGRQRTENAMFNKRTILIEFAVGMTVATLTLGGAGAGSAQPAQREYIAATDTYSVMTENDQAVLVLGILKPRKRTAFVSAPARLNYFLTDCEYRTIERSGKTAHWKMAAGNAGSSAPIEAISLENIGKSNCRMISFEPKAPSASVGATQFPQEAPRCFAASPDICSVIAQNDSSVLVKAVLKPGQQTDFFSLPPRVVLLPDGLHAQRNL